MKVLMISTDRALLGEQVATGDAVKRHIDYGRQVNRLDIIVLSGPGYEARPLSDRVICYPTNSKSRWNYVKDAIGLAGKIMENAVYDLAVCQDPFLAGLIGDRLKRKYGIKLLVHFHGDFWGNRYWLKENPLRLALLWLSRRVVKKADFIRVVSDGIKRKLVKNGVASRRIKVISTPVDLEQFSAPDNQTVSSIKDEFKGSKIILWVGKMRTEKNLEFLLKSFKLIQGEYGRVALLMVGQGKDFDKLNKLRLELGLAKTVKMAGYVDYKILPNYFFASDIIVLPSRHESFGKVLLEAAAAGKPVVASKTTGAREIVEDGNTGFLVDINNQKQFKDKALELLRNDELAAKMGREACDSVRSRFDYNRQIDEAAELWREAVNSKH